METEARIGKGKAPKGVKAHWRDTLVEQPGASSLPQPLGKGPLPQETQDNDVPSMPGEVESSLQVGVFHIGGVAGVGVLGSV
jgi:hypothetical protein